MPVMLSPGCGCCGGITCSNCTSAAGNASNVVLNDAIVGTVTAVPDDCVWGFTVGQEITFARTPGGYGFTAYVENSNVGVGGFAQQTRLGVTLCFSGSIGATGDAYGTNPNVGNVGFVTAYTVVSCVPLQIDVTWTLGFSGCGGNGTVTVSFTE